MGAWTRGRVTGLNMRKIQNELKLKVFNLHCVKKVPSEIPKFQSITHTIRFLTKDYIISLEQPHDS